jgi:hypothetical protein
MESRSEERPFFRVIGTDSDYKMVRYDLIPGWDKVTTTATS